MPTKRRVGDKFRGHLSDVERHRQPRDLQRWFGSEGGRRVEATPVASARAGRRPVELACAPSRQSRPRRRGASCQLPCMFRRAHTQFWYLPVHRDGRGSVGHPIIARASAVSSVQHTVSWGTRAVGPYFWAPGSLRHEGAYPLCVASCGSCTLRGSRQRRAADLPQQPRALADDERCTGHMHTHYATHARMYTHALVGSDAGRNRPHRPQACAAAWRGSGTDTRHKAQHTGCGTPRPPASRRSRRIRV